MGASGTHPYAPAGSEPGAAAQAAQPLVLTADERSVLAELLEAERAKLLVEIRHTDHRAYKQGLRVRLEIVEKMLAHCQCG